MKSLNFKNYECYQFFMQTCRRYHLNFFPYKAEIILHTYFPIHIHEFTASLKRLAFVVKCLVIVTFL